MRLLLILLLALLPAWAFATATGEARDQRGELIYTERHIVDGDRHVVEYRDSAGQLFATNRIDYSFGAFHPAYRQENLREGEAEGARWQNDRRLELFHAEDGGGEQMKVVDAPQPLVLSSGFDNFIREHWDQLQRGERLNFHFAIPARLMLVELRVRRVDGDDPAGGLALRAEARSALWRLISKPIDLFYDADRRLLRYRGVSNLELGGDSPWVDVTYRYDERPAALRSGDSTVTAR